MTTPTFSPGDRVRVVGKNPAHVQTYLLDGQAGTVTKAASWGEGPRVTFDYYPIELLLGSEHLELLP